jgi:hypothetical protein
LTWLVFTRQYDDPVLLIPAGVKRDGVQGKVSVRNLLPGVFTTITVLIDHYSPALRDLNANRDKPVLRLEFADLPKTISGKIRRVDLRVLELKRSEGATVGGTEYIDDTKS